MLSALPQMLLLPYLSVRKLWWSGLCHWITLGIALPLIMTTPPFVGLLVRQSHSSLLIAVHTGATW